MESLLSQQLQQALLDIQMRKKHQEPDSLPSSATVNGNGASPSQISSLQEITVPSTCSYSPLSDRDERLASSVAFLPHQHISQTDTVFFHDPVLQYINDTLMAEDIEDPECMQLQCASYQATAKGFYDILAAESSNGSCCTREGFAMQADQRSGGLEGHHSAGISALHQERALQGHEYDEYKWMNALLNDVVWSPACEPDEASAAAESARTSSVGNSLLSTSNEARDSSPVTNPEYYGAPMQSASSPTVTLPKYGMGPEIYSVSNKELNHISTLRAADSSVSKDNTSDQPFGKSDSGTAPMHASRGSRKVKRAASQVDGTEVAHQLRPHSSPLSVKRSVVALSKEEAVSYVQNNDLNAEMWAKLLIDGPATLNSHPAFIPENTDKGEWNSGEITDLKRLLVLCAHAIAENEIQKAYELLQVIGQRASLFGSAEQRLAHYFSEGLLARLSDTGGQLFTAFVNTTPSATKLLKAYHLFVEVCPFFKISHYFANKAILEAAEGASRLHIVDYGILHGLQWPSLISALAKRRGGPPLLRITGIDYTHLGIKVAVTSRRLSEYAKTYGVPFEYHAIASKWGIIRTSSVHLQEDEVLVVNSMFRLRHLPDETVLASNPRKTVLSRIQAMNPKVFVQGVKSANYNSPFFMSRFKEALTFFSNNFDMIDSTTDRDNQERMTIEREMMGRDVINVVACEGLERIERPETYKQWENRTRRAGFEQMPLAQNMLREAQVIGQATYNKNFSVDQDGCWMLLGWKGKTILGLSVWRPSGHE